MQPASSPIDALYRRAHPTSYKLYERARQLIPGGITHDIRYLTPFPVYVDPTIVEPVTSGPKKKAPTRPMSSNVESMTWPGPVPKSP